MAAAPRSAKGSSGGQRPALGLLFACLATALVVSGTPAPWALGREPPGFQRFDWIAQALPPEVERVSIRFQSSQPFAEPGTTQAYWMAKYALIPREVETEHEYEYMIFVLSTRLPERALRIPPGYALVSSGAERVYLLRRKSP